MAEQKNRIKTAVAGCGAISEIYLKNMIEKFDNLEVTACCARHIESAKKRAGQFGICAFTYEEILKNSEIRLIVILTPVPTHYLLIRKALEAGKHVYTEKTMTAQLSEARELLELADEKGLYLGAAPDTFLGSGLQTAKKAMEEGLIGEVTSFQIAANRNLDYQAGRFAFLRLPGSGICYDYGVYYLTAIVELLGPVKGAFAMVKNRKEFRINADRDSEEYGTEFHYPGESQVTALLEMGSGITGNLMLNGDSIERDLSVFYIYGTKGILKLANPDCFGGKVEVIPDGVHTSKRPFVPDYGLPYSENSRGLGVSEMAAAILCGGEHPANKEQAYHVLDVIETIMQSGKSGGFERVESGVFS